MKKIFALLVFGCSLVFGQSLRDVVPSMNLNFNGMGSTVNTYTMEFRFKADTSIDYFIGSSNMYCRPLAGRLACYVGTETGGYASIPITNGVDYRARFIHDYGVGSNYLLVWTGNCTLVGQTYFTPDSSKTLVMADTWEIKSGQHLSFWRLFTGISGSTAATGCPVDRTITPADLFDFSYETNVGTAETTMDRDDAEPGSAYDGHHVWSNCGDHGTVRGSGCREVYGVLAEHGGQPQLPMAGRWYSFVLCAHAYFWTRIMPDHGRHNYQSEYSL